MKDQSIQCTCGHINPPGTQLCQNCGRLINDNYDKKKIADVMRYDGQAIRSKTKNKSLADKVWNFFASVKTGVTLLVLTVIASAIGTMLPQQYFIPVGEDPSTFYQDKYGTLGLIYYRLGFDNLYTSWWFLILLALVAFSIIAASIDRGIPLHKSLTRQTVKKHPSFFKRQRLTLHDDRLDMSLIETLKDNKYKVREEAGFILAEKGRISRYGPYINHTGLIILLAGAMLRFVPMFYVDEFVGVGEGETKVIPGTENQYYIKNNQFIFEQYDKESMSNTNSKSADATMNKIAKNYESKITLFENKSDSSVIGSKPELVKLKDDSIRVNHPVKFGQFALYQNSFDQSQLKTMIFKVQDKQGKQIGKNFEVELDNPNDDYKISDTLNVHLRNYAPDFDKITENGALATKSPLPNNPAFVFEVNDGKKSEYSLLKIRSSQDISKDNQYDVKFVSATNKTITYLTVKKDLTLPILFVGFTIFLFGLAIGSYINHRRIWINTNEGMLAAHTNRNYYGFKHEIDTMLHKHHLREVNDKYEVEDKNE
ncbi:cytochrome c biogenesis protein ResB [Macrococcoides caseolyticum]|uniref:cytochrome c biogenesis protein ResB n=1 Tax=Macrococcoides caseolyticum TaxID=69966 RepID=UPI000C339AB3|nr:cytochrome c biogenesis protein ResB [Macrococcus caseolyticus]PKE64153.1 cytochrome c biogenesis protein ResB [Macrococcus caseolyticus]PKF45233.1 cytochrome c biogenesis protein ResB [Macrococcus caseolyticus]